MSRKLASIQIIKDIQPIEGKDRIMLATIEGWHVIVGKDDFKIGDKCVYIEIDSVLDPDNPIFEQARKRSNRVRTMKLGGIYSEGIAYPLWILPNMIDDHTVSYEQYHEGDDVTDLLHIVKYDEYGDSEKVPSVSIKKPKYNKLQLFWYKLFGFPEKIRKNEFPSLISKTDEERIQNIPEALNYKEPVIVTQKIDGCSASYLLEKVGWFGKENFTVASRNYSLTKDNSHYWQIAEKYDIKERLSLLREELNVPWVCIQGEIAGPGIQKNPSQLKELDFFVFNLITPNGRIGTKEMVEILYKYGIPTVPVLNYNYILPDTVDEMLKYATGSDILNPQALREGVVIRSQDGIKSFKAVSPEYLIKHNK